jgi:hypothetical protein
LVGLHPIAETGSPGEEKVRRALAKANADLAALERAMAEHRLEHARVAPGWPCAGRRTSADGPPMQATARHRSDHVSDRGQRHFAAAAGPRAVMRALDRGEGRR